MNRTIDFTQAGGLHLYQDTLAYMQKAYSDVSDAIAGILGNKLILSGCTEQNGSVSEGWIVINGEVIPFASGLKADYITIETTTATEQFEDGEQKPVYTVKKARLSTISSGNVAFSDFVRLPFGENLKDFAFNVKTIQKALVLENEVILSGCAASVNASILSVSSGYCMFSGKLVQTPAYTGASPVYLKEDGNYSNTLPISGTYITFDPYTSQRYTDVLNRALTKVGKIEMYETRSDRFDAAGIGKWEMKGFQLMESMQGRVPLGLWYDGKSVDNITDYAYTVAGTRGGEKTHTLSIAEMPKHNHDLKYLPKGGKDGDSVIGAQPGETTNSSTMREAGGGAAHNNVQPYTVVVYVKRIA
ncbi:hypothetical protein SAMN05421788_101841 [Filimonas lacunae]|uniref:Baseplate structural protein Gp10 C-terminal domain-containing protein n=1 Tax=Filimonas lacunae TaxID=477680 RepID=A0A173MP10_9BACT|nr:hypothetical protein [Filimonas lacunae]BAV09405.1 phage tail fiber protein [Filimonas lacunae]SIS72546.1 hypothetical protein SAMN05421788_101841 [Filimonas lacunae]